MGAGSSKDDASEPFARVKVKEHSSNAQQQGTTQQHEQQGAAESQPKLSVAQQKLGTLVCACVCECVCACARARVNCACVCVWMCASQQSHVRL